MDIEVAIKAVSPTISRENVMKMKKQHFNIHFRLHAFAKATHPSCHTRLLFHAGFRTYLADTSDILQCVDI